MYRRKYSNNELLEKILLGGTNLEEAFRDLMNSEKSSRTIQRFIFRRGGSQEDYEEIFNDTLLALHNGIVTGRFRDESKVGHYMKSTARNLLYNKFKRNKTKIVPIDHRIEDQEPSIEQNIIKNERKNMLKGIISKLGHSCERILIMAFIENYKNKELQLTLEYKNDGVVRKVKSKCLRKLREMLKGSPELYRKMNL